MATPQTRRRAALPKVIVCERWWRYDQCCNHTSCDRSHGSERQNEHGLWTSWACSGHSYEGKLAYMDKLNLLFAPTAGLTNCLSLMRGGIPCGAALVYQISQSLPLSTLADEGGPECLICVPSRDQVGGVHTWGRSNATG